MEPRDDERPDPDELLRRVQAEDKRAGRARLHVFFAFAPGVGKTYRMLQAARDLRSDGVDVVVGLVETHGRSETARLLDGLEVLARQTLGHRGRAARNRPGDGAILRIVLPLQGQPPAVEEALR